MQPVDTRKNPRKIPRIQINKLDLDLYYLFTQQYSNQKSKRNIIFVKRRISSSAANSRRRRIIFSRYKIQKPLLSIRILSPDVKIPLP